MDDDLKPLFQRLTRLQKGVCLGVLDGMTQREAYYAAGGLAKNDDYADQVVSRMLSRDIKVKAFMEAAEGKALKDTVMRKQEALERLSNYASADVSELFTDDWQLKPKSELTPEQRAIISEVHLTKDGFKIKTHSAPGAKKQLADLLGWNAPQKVANTDSDGNDQPGLTEMARTIVFALESAMGNKDTDSNSNSNGDLDE